MTEEFIEMDIPRPNKMTPVGWFVSKGYGTPLCLTTTTGTVEDIHTFADEGCFEEVFWFNSELEAMEALAKYYLKHRVDFPYNAEWYACINKVNTEFEIVDNKESCSQVMEFI